jgi:hypothetical protein
MIDIVGAVNDLYPADVVAFCRPSYGLDLLASTQAQVKAEGFATKRSENTAAV